MHALVDWLDLGSIFRHPGSKEDLRTCLYSSHAPICVCHHESIKKVTNCEYLADGYKTSIALWSKSKLAPPVKPVQKRERESVHCTSTNFHPDSTPVKHNQVIINLLHIHLNINFCKYNCQLRVSYFAKFLQTLTCHKYCSAKLGPKLEQSTGFPPCTALTAIIWLMFDGSHSVCLRLQILCVSNENCFIWFSSTFVELVD